MRTLRLLVVSRTLFPCEATTRDATDVHGAINRGLEKMNFATMMKRYGVGIRWKRYRCVEKSHVDGIGRVDSIGTSNKEEKVRFRGERTGRRGVFRTFSGPSIMHATIQSRAITRRASYRLLADIPLSTLLSFHPGTFVLVFRFFFFTLLPFRVRGWYASGESECDGRAELHPVPVEERAWYELMANTHKKAIVNYRSLSLASSDPPPERRNFKNRTRDLSKEIKKVYRLRMCLKFRIFQNQRPVSRK